MFDEVVVAVARNAAKTPLLTVDERVALATEVFAGDDRVRVEPVAGLLADFVRGVGATAVVKGLRGGADLDAELPMALMNRHLSGVETVFVVAEPTLAHVASSLVKDVARHGGPIGDLVPEPVAAAVLRALAVAEGATGDGAAGQRAAGQRATAERAVPERAPADGGASGARAAGTDRRTDGAGVGTTGGSTR